MEERPSRSAKKRQATALQNLGEELLRSPDIWPSLPDELRGAIRECAGMKDYEARRRQQQYIGRLMRELDEESLATITRLIIASTKNSNRKLDITGAIA